MNIANASFLPTRQPGMDTSAEERADPRWNGLYTIGATAALTTASITVAGVASFIAWLPPSGATVTE